MFATGLIKEEGLGANASPTANCYADVADANNYFSARNNSDWSGATTAAKAAALIDATDYLVQKYRLRWLGIRVSDAQPLDWPRAGVVIEDTYQIETLDYPASSFGLANEIAQTVVPVEVVKATCELALRRIESATTKLWADQDRGGDIQRVKAGSVEVTYGDMRRSDKEYPAVYGLIEPFLKRSSAHSRALVRG